MMMSTYQATTLFDHTLAGEETRETIKSRFGEIVIDTRNALLFPKGLLGMPQAQHFVLANLPSEKMQQFKLLQCLDDFSLSFIVLPLTFTNAIVRPEDMAIAARELEVEEANLVALLIVCVHRQADSTRLSVNARAPVFVDASRKAGMQYVFMHDMYKVQHFIN